MALNDPKQYKIEWGGRELVVETGRVAKQAGGAVVVRYAETMVLVAATAGENPIQQSFLPLTVDYREQTYAGGKIPGGFFKREGRPSEKDIHVSRLIDRPIRPLFPDGWNFDTQVIAKVVSHDGANDSDIPAILGASAALTISDIPFQGPIAGARVGYIDGRYVLNPTIEQLEVSLLDATIVCSEESVVMVEGGARFVSEEVLTGALEFAFEHTRPLIELQKQMAAELAKPKRELPPPEPPDPELVAAIEERFGARLREAAQVPAKQERSRAFKAIGAEILEAFGVGPDGEDRSAKVNRIVGDLKKRIVRALILEEGRRVDGRDLTTVRPIEIDLGYLPRAHGSALFTRGETQALVSVTLGTQEDEQKVDTLEGESWKRFYLHYNFPPYSVGETRPLRGPGRREIGHGLLAERAMVPALPDEEEFPYTIRVVSEITESNGSSSMATVCGASLALMDAGVPISTHIAGVAMGLIKEGDRVAILTDILGDEDHLGDMDFKVAGSTEGITSFQMDIKIAGIDRETMARALEQARQARLHILERMRTVIERPRPKLSPFAPRLLTMRIPPEKIGDVIGPGGKVIRGIVQETGTRIDIEEDGLIRIYSPSMEGAERAKRRIERIVKEVRPGEYYVGTVRKIVDFGAFVEILPGTDGLVHISEIAPQRIRSVRDVLEEGDRIPVVVLEVDPNGKIRLSRKRALDKTIEEIEAEQGL